MSSLLGSIRTFTKTAAMTAILATLAACGGGGSETAVETPTTPQTPTNDPPPPPVVGVQTPNNVSVVTATNAG